MTIARKDLTESPTWPLNWQSSLALLIIISAIAVASWVGQSDADMAVFWLMGLAFGFVLQRSRFCFASAFRDLFLQRSGISRCLSIFCEKSLLRRCHLPASAGFWSGSVWDFCQG